MAARTLEEIDTEARARAASVLTRVPANIAALIERSPMRLTLCLTLHTIFTAKRREEIARAGGHFDGLVFALNMAGGKGDVWTAEEWAALEDYGHLAESTALAQLVED